MAESMRSRGRRRGRDLSVEVGKSIRTARLAAGVSQSRLGEAVDLSASEISRIERGRAPWLSITKAAEICAVLGLDLWVRCYPAGDPLRDAGHVALLERVRARIKPPLSVRAEVPLPLARDPRAWDLVAYDRQASAAFEAETRITDVQALARRLQTKKRDGQVDVLVLFVADRRANRSAIRAVRELLRADFPLDGDTVLQALAAGTLPRASGIVFL